MTTAVAPVAPAALTRRWHAMRAHAIQRAYYESRHRFNVVPAGRRSGKTEIAKRRLVKRAVRGSKFDSPRYFAGAPTWDQAKRIFWRDLKRMVPREAMRGNGPKPWSDGELVIPLWHGGELFVVGLDKPERIEGAPIDGGVLDEYANMKEQAWGENVRPALSDRNAWCDLIGVPEGRNHYFKTAEKAKAELLELGEESEWAYFHWKSADILPAAEIAAAKRDLDELTFQQEYEASFVNFEGRAYYGFTDENKLPVRQLYDPRQPLLICLDFNVAPGVAVIAQELRLRTIAGAPPTGKVVTCAIGEVYIENNSNTPAVCRRILTDWNGHQGRVEVYGDATGGNRGSAKVEGSDWDLVKRDLVRGFKGVGGFGQRVMFFDQDENPAERARLNAMNTRIHNASGERSLYVDPKAAPHLVDDLEGVRLLKGGSGEIDKKIDPKLTHVSDALGYYVAHRFPVAEVGTWGSGTWTQ
jgi:hypothetical protein